jgi:hypothetical protein
MLKRLFEKSVELSVGAGQLKFKDLSEFEYALKDKTALSSTTVSGLGKLSDDALMREAEAYRSMERHIVDVLSSPENGIDRFLKRLELDRISEDHDWRDLIGAIRNLDEACGPYKKAALLKYVAYLSAAQDIIRTIRVNRLGSVDDPDDRVRGQANADLSQRQRLMFDLQALADIGGTPALSNENGFARMSKGESVEIQFGQHQSLDIMLAKYRFTLVSGRPFLIIDETGHDLKVGAGKNIIGRSAHCNVTLGNAFGAVSRKHLVVEVDNKDRVRLTPRELIGSKLH